MTGMGEDARWRYSHPAVVRLMEPSYEPPATIGVALAILSSCRRPFPSRSAPLILSHRIRSVAFQESCSLERVFRGAMTPFTRIDCHAL